MKDYAIKVENVTKKYRLGAIGGNTLKADLQSLKAKILMQEDPNTKIGSNLKIGEEFWALNGISFQINKGDRIGLIGHNGAGKSTLLKLLSRVTAPTNGEIIYKGRIASMLEVGTGFHPELTGRENIYLNGAILGMSRKEIDKKIDDIIAFAEIKDFVDTPVKRYSSGMYVKLAFSVAAHLDSEIMIMDEVLAVGDMKFQQKCLDKMNSLAKDEGKTILYVSHNMNTIRQLCNRCIVLKKGKVVYDGDVENAIAIYMGISSELLTKYKYTSEFHSRAHATNELAITELVIDNYSQSKFVENSIVRIKIKCNAISDIEDLHLRLEIQFNDSSLAGTMFSNKGISFKKDEERWVEFDMNCSHLAVGKYRADLAAFVVNRFGTEQLIDGVYPAFSFEIIENNDENNKLLWNHRYWGHVQLNDLIIDGDLK